MSSEMPLVRIPLIHLYLLLATSVCSLRTFPWRRVSHIVATVANCLVGSLGSSCMHGLSWLMSQNISPYHVSLVLDTCVHLLCPNVSVCLLIWFPPVKLLSGFVSPSGPSQVSPSFATPSSVNLLPVSAPLSSNWSRERMDEDSLPRMEYV